MRRNGRLRQSVAVKLSCAHTHRHGIALISKMLFRPLELYEYLDPSAVRDSFENFDLGHATPMLGLQRQFPGGDLPAQDDRPLLTLRLGSETGKQHWTACSACRRGYRPVSPTAISGVGSIQDKDSAETAIGLAWRAKQVFAVPRQREDAIARARVISRQLESTRPCGNNVLPRLSVQSDLIQVF